jgi:PAS domain S-box-containing protein
MSHLQPTRVETADFAHSSIFEALFASLSAGLAIDRAVVILQHPLDLWTIVADAEQQCQIRHYPAITLADYSELPHTIVSQVLHQGHSIQLNQLPEFSTDPYWQRQGFRPFIALPLVDLPLVEPSDNAGHKPIGALYLETHSPFPAERLEALRAIVQQTVISLHYRNTYTAETTINRTFQQLVEQANDVIFMITLDGKFDYLSPKFAELVGADPQKYIDRPFAEIIHPDDLGRISQVLKQQRLLGHQVNEVEFRLRRQNGDYLWVAANNSAPITDVHGNPIGFQGIVRDIHHRKLAEQALQQAQSRLQFLIATTPAIIHSISISRPPRPHRISYISDNLTTILGFPITAFQGNLSHWGRRVHPDDRARVSQLYHDTIAAKSECQAEYRLLNHHGQYQWLYSAMKVLVDDAGTAIEAVGYTADITPRRLAEEQLHQTNQELLISNTELARATRLKDEFLANMSHELRTPLNAILGISEAMSDEVYGPMSEPYRKSIKIIEQSGQHLLELINDILDLAKIEAGRLEIRPSSTSLKYLCESSLSFVRQLAINKKIQLLHDDHYGMDCLEVDERRMRQVLINLLSNAVKFTPKGGTIELIAQISPDHKQFQFQVKDTGIGIAASNLADLFQPFVQIDSRLNRQFSGTGLGLTLVKRIIDLHQGHIAVTSTPNQGSCFTITLPIAQSFSLPPVESEDQALSRIPVTHPEAPLILLAEDNSTNIEIMEDYLHAQGYAVVVAQNGHEAIAYSQQQQPDLILMDIQMPGMDGLEAIAQLRQNRSYDDMPIIALTALAMPGDAERCRRAGANDYLSKPVKLKQLTQTIERHLAQRIPH